MKLFLLSDIIYVSLAMLSLKQPPLEDLNGEIVNIVVLREAALTVVIVVPANQQTVMSYLIPSAAPWQTTFHADPESSEKTRLG